MAALKRLSKLQNPAAIIVGYPVALVAVAGLLLAFPFSGILLVLFSALVGAFLTFAISVLLVVYVFFTIALARAFIDLGRRLLGPDERIEPQRAKKKRGREATGGGLWDAWIDRSW
jgi:multisubunit Na+/H+ antiporter MnhE subunit